jgi:hypothetical protein
MKKILAIIPASLLASSLFAQNEKTIIKFSDNHFYYNYEVEVEAYTPIVNFYNEVYDTLNVLEFSKAMKELGLRNLYFNPPKQDLIRLSRFTHNKTTIFEIESKGDSFELIMTTCLGQYFSLNELTKNQVRSLLSAKEFSELKKHIENSGFWALDISSSVVPREYVFESVIAGEYYYRYKGETDLTTTKQGKNMIKLFDDLEKRK